MLVQQGTRPQRTVRRSVEVGGVGFLSGAVVHVCFHPAPADTGIVFHRTDVEGAPALWATPANVSGTTRRTTLGIAPAQVELVEHVLAALHGLRIDNCHIEIDAAELPGLDGSAHGFALALADAGVEVQDAERPVWAATMPISVADRTATLTLYPDPVPGLRVSYLLDYGERSPIAPQRHTHEITPEEFCAGLDDARTFLLKEEAEALRKQGIGAQTTLEDLVVFGPHGPLENTLRAADEPARHKVLDIVGDLALVGCDLQGHVIGCRSGHSLNVALARKLAAEIGARSPGKCRRAA